MMYFVYEGGPTEHYPDGVREVWGHHFPTGKEVAVPEDYKLIAKLRSLGLREVKKRVETKPEPPQAPPETDVPRIHESDDDTKPSIKTKKRGRKKKDE